MSAASFLGADMRVVRREVAGAADAQVLQVLRYVDSLQDRSRADDLLAPLRDRLRQLRPERPLRLPRVLFVPLDPAIVAPMGWRAGAPSVPRSAIAPFASLVQRALPGEAAAATAILDNGALPAAMRVRAAGEVMWRLAGLVLRAAETPPEWSATGLPYAEFAPLARACAATLVHAVTLHDLDDPAVPALELNPALATMLQAAHAEGPAAWGMLLKIMTRRFPAAQAPLRAAIAARADRTLRPVAEAVAEAAWLWLGEAAGGPQGDAAEMAADLRRQVALIEELGRDPANRRRVGEAQTSLRAACAARIDSGLKERLLMPITTLGAQELARDEVVEKLESDARDLRQLDLAARRLGGEAGQDSAMSRAARAIAASATMGLMDRARIVEILLGAQAAASLLQTSGGG